MNREKILQKVDQNDSLVFYAFCVVAFGPTLPLPVIFSEASVVIALSSFVGWLAWFSISFWVYNRLDKNLRRVRDWVLFSTTPN